MSNEKPKPMKSCPTVRRTNLKKRYGLTEDQYLELLRRQSGECGICGVYHTETVKRFAVDHCHSTDEIRGLLCSECNAGLGKLGDSLESVENALKYLQKPYSGFYIPTKRRK